jgi:competence protein ComEA
MKRFLYMMLAAMISLSAWAGEAVNVNNASAEEIAENLKGVGMSKAQAIVDYREKHGSFIHVDELVNVKGIGIRTVDLNRGMILLKDSQESARD